MKKFINTLKDHARNAKGSYKTVYDRVAFARRFGRYLRLKNIQIGDIEHLKVKHIEGYVETRLRQGIGIHTLQNEMAMIRKIVREADKNGLFDQSRLTNRNLGLYGASRDGTKQAISNQYYNQVIGAALEKDRGLAAAIILARLLGLRSEEAVQSIQSLQTWKNALDQGKTQLPITFGTKGGRPRMTTIVDRKAVTKAVNFALSIARSRNGRLIDKPNLKKAMTYWRNHTSALGLTGKNSPHSLRYAWAQDALKHHLAQGFSRKEALALTSMDLGHGDGRGRYVERVYGLKAI